MTQRLEDQLLDIGIACRVEARDGLALVIPTEGLALDTQRRSRIVQLARAEGFTHVAIEIDPAESFSAPTP